MQPSFPTKRKSRVTLNWVYNRSTVQTKGITNPVSYACRQLAAANEAYERMACPGPGTTNINNPTCYLHTAYALASCSLMALHPQPLPPCYTLLALLHMACYKKPVSSSSLSACGLKPSRSASASATASGTGPACMCTDASGACTWSGAA